MAETIIASSILILMILLVRKLIGKHLSRRLLFGLWIIVAIRLLILPFITVPQNFSVMKVLSQPIAEISNKANSVAFSRSESDAALSEDDIQDVDKVYSEGTSNSIDESLRTKEITIGSIFIIIWITGILVTMVVILLPLVRFCYHIYKRRQFFEKIPDVRLKVFTVVGLETPCLLWNCIYVPETLVNKNEQYGYAKLHEITHYRHADPLWNFIRFVSVCVYWFHPLVWVAAFLSKKDSETACDEGVVAKLNEEDKKMYCQILLEIATGRSFQKNIFLTGSGMAEGNVLKRIRIMNSPSSAKKGISVVVIIVLLVLSGVTMNANASGQGKALFTESKDYSMYLMSKDVKITRLSYLRDSLSTEFSNTSKNTYLIQTNELEYYNEAESNWVTVCRPNLEKGQMYAICPDQSDRILMVLSDIQKSRGDSLVVYGNNIEENLTQTYGNLPKGNYRMLYLLMQKDGTEEIVYGYFEKE